MIERRESRGIGGANVKALQRMLGHAKASMTLDVYSDLFDDDLDGVANTGCGDPGWVISCSPTAYRQG